MGQFSRWVCIRSMVEHRTITSSHSYSNHWISNVFAVEFVSIEGSSVRLESKFNSDIFENNNWIWQEFSETSRLSIFITYNWQWEKNEDWKSAVDYREKCSARVNNRWRSVEEMLWTATRAYRLHELVETCYGNDLITLWLMQVIVKRRDSSLACLARVLYLRNIYLFLFLPLSRERRRKKSYWYISFLFKSINNTCLYQIWSVMIDNLLSCKNTSDQGKKKKRRSFAYLFNEWWQLPVDHLSFFERRRGEFSSLALS